MVVGIDVFGVDVVTLTVLSCLAVRLCRCCLPEMRRQCSELLSYQAYILVDQLPRSKGLTVYKAEIWYISYSPQHFSSD
jgi:hypothetical protein